MTLTSKPEGAPARWKPWEYRIAPEIEDAVSQVSRAVLVEAPHTSLWDGYHTVVGRHVRKVNDVLDMSTLEVSLKSEFATKPGIGLLLQWLGFYPVDRKHIRQFKQHVDERFKSGEPYLLGLSPESTRDPVSEWKNGFLKFARKYEVPILAAMIDYSKRVFEIGCIIQPSELDDTTRILNQYYDGVVPAYPEGFAHPFTIQGERERVTN